MLFHMRWKMLLDNIYRCTSFLFKSIHLSGFSLNSLYDFVKLPLAAQCYFMQFLNSACSYVLALIRMNYSYVSTTLSIFSLKKSLSQRFSLGIF